MRMHNVDVKSSVWISWITWISWIIIHEIHENAKVTFADVNNKGLLMIDHEILIQDGTLR